MNKNNTNYPTNLNNRIKDDLLIVSNKLNNKLFDYQKIVYNYLIDRDNRGLLVYFGLGTGKTLTAVSIAEHFRNKGKDIIVLAPKSLQENFKKGIKQYNNNITDKNISDDYKFVTSNASNMIKQLDTNERLDKQLQELSKINIDNKVIIIDEAHTLCNSIVNGSKNANDFYDIVMNAKNIKIIFLTATPIVNHAFELAPMLNMCKGKIYKKTTDIIKLTKKNDYYTILPEYYQDFVKLFIDEEKNTIKNKSHFQNRIFGLVAYNGDLFKEKQESFTKELKMSKLKKDFPDRLPIKIIKVNMSLVQNVEYSKFREKERYEASKSYKGGAIFKDKFSTSSSYRIRSRQISNVYIKDKYELGSNEYEFDIKKLKKYSPKMKKIYEIIKNCHKKQLGVIYSTFLQNGLEYMEKILLHYKYESFIDNIDINKGIDQLEPKLRYAMFTGKINIEVRNYMINIYNSPENKNGEYIQLLLISSTGEKGINLKRVRHLHIMEPQWNYTTLEQVMGRAVRYKSHIDLPTKDQNVQIYMYISEYNEEFLLKEKEKVLLIKKESEPMEYTTDKTLLFKSIKNKELNDKFLTVLAETSIDCNIFNEERNFKCYSCNPTNEQLYYEDINVDVEIPSRCNNDGDSITVDEVIINDETYYYTNKDNELIVYKKNELNENFIEVIDKKIINKIKKNI